MLEEEWPVATPRDELLARVAARGSRIRSLRRAAQGAVIASVLAVSAAGGVAVFSSLGGDGSDGNTELAIQTDPSDPERPSTTLDTREVSDAEGAVPVPVDGSNTDTDTDSGDGTQDGLPTDVEAVEPVEDGSSTPGNTPTTVTSAPSRPGSTSTTAPREIESPTTLPVPVEAVPTLGQLRTRTTGVPTGTSLCLGEPDSFASIPADEATRVVVSWKDGDIQHSIMAEHDGSEWRASLASITARLDRHEVVHVTVTATGPGGTTDSSQSVDVVDCS